MIIGITGSYCSGKDTAAEYLIRKKGFRHCSLSDELRRELERRGISSTRENLIRVGTELRAKEGNEVLASRVLEHCTAGDNHVITSIRHPAEIEKLRQQRNDFVLINIDAPADVRFRRMRSRNRPGDPETVEKFRELEEKESQTEGSGQQLQKCSAMASRTLMNDSDDVQCLYSRIDALLGELERGQSTRVTRKVLIIEDDPDASDAVQTLFEMNHIAAVAASDGETGIAKARQEKPDLIMLDIMLPGMDGYEVCERLKKDSVTGDIPIIMVTAKDMGDDVEKAMDKHADGYIAKPYDMKYLLERVNHLISTRRKK